MPKISIRIQDSDYRRLMAAARASGMSLSEYVRSVIGQSSHSHTADRRLRRLEFVITRLLFVVLEQFKTPNQITEIHKHIIMLTKEKFPREE
jgi:uncharacterized protein (DUF1778 family)